MKWKSDNVFLIEKGSKNSIFFLFTQSKIFGKIKTNIRSGLEVKGLEIIQNESRKEVHEKIGEHHLLNIPIQMVAAMDRNGKITPMWFRYENQDHTIETVKIWKTECRDEVCYVGIREKRYICTVMMNESYHVLDIRYRIEKQTWRIFQFLS